MYFYNGLLYGSENDDLRHTVNKKMILKMFRERSIHNDSIVTKLGNRKDETFVINVKKSQRMINIQFSVVVVSEEST